MQRFKTRMSPLALLLTIVIHLFVGVAVFSSFRTIGRIQAAGVSLLMLGTFLPAFLLRPFRYDLEAGELVIRKHLLPRRVPVAQIAAASEVSYGELKITIRVWASGGLWGWYGIFLSSRYGRLTMQCTELKNLVMLTLADGKKIVLSPSDPKSLLAALALPDGH